MGRGHNRNGDRDLQIFSRESDAIGIAMEMYISVPANDGNEVGEHWNWMKKYWKQNSRVDVDV